MSERIRTLVFGQGPVEPHEPVKKINMPHTPPTKRALNWWGSELTAGAAELYQRGATDSFSLMGGKTMDKAVKDSLSADELDEWPAESQLVDGKIRAIIIQNPPTTPEPGREIVIVNELGSTNTLENLANICNEQLDTDEKMGITPEDIMGASFHLTRMKILMKLFNIPYRRVIGAKNMMEYAAIEAGDDAMLLDIQQRHDINAALRKPLNTTEKLLDVRAKERGVDLGYYAARDDVGLKTVAEKQQEEDVWTRALLTIPEYSLPYFAKIRNDERLMAIMRNFDTIFFPATDAEQSALANHTIDLLTDTPNEIRQKLGKIVRKAPDEDTRTAWINEHREKGWPVEIEEKFQRILA